MIKVKKIANYLFGSMFLFSLTAIGLLDNPSSRWNYQEMPILNNSNLADIIFLDSLNGYAVTGNFTGGLDSNYVLKTTNSGYNWTVVLNQVEDFLRVKFLNVDTGYVLHLTEIFRTTNAGLNWTALPNLPKRFGLYDMAVVSYDTIWIIFSYFGTEYIYRTTNAGNSWSFQVERVGIERLYFYNNKLGFATSKGGIAGTDILLRTSNGGLNWSQQLNNAFAGIGFIDSLRGWKTSGDQIKKTTNGGVNWTVSYLPTWSSNIENYLTSISVINQDTIYGTGGYIRYPGYLINRGLVYRTTNGGSNWAYQIVDTSYRVSNFKYTFFLNKNVGWIYSYYKKGVYTTSGGDTTFVSAIENNNVIFPTEFILHQNYPNPFNPKTQIGYELKTSGYVNIVVHDLLGKKIFQLINRRQHQGSHTIEFKSDNLTSGIYFYSLFINEKRMDTKKMILIK